MRTGVRLRSLQAFYHLLIAHSLSSHLSITLRLSTISNHICISEGILHSVQSITVTFTCLYTNGPARRALRAPAAAEKRKKPLRQQSINQDTILFVAVLLLLSFLLQDLAFQMITLLVFLLLQGILSLFFVQAASIESSLLFSTF
jgi:hypothetical protein